MRLIFIILYVIFFVKSYTFWQKMLLNMYYLFIFIFSICYSKNYEHK